MRHGRKLRNVGIYSGFDYLAIRLANATPARGSGWLYRSSRISGYQDCPARTLWRNDENSIFTSVETQVHEIFECWTIQVASSSIESTGAFFCRAVRAPHYDPLHDRIALRRRGAVVEHARVLGRYSLAVIDTSDPPRGTSETSTSASSCTVGKLISRGSFVFLLGQSTPAVAAVTQGYPHQPRARPELSRVHLSTDLLACRAHRWHLPATLPPSSAQRWKASSRGRTSDK